MATIVTSMSSNVGNAIGCLFPSFFVDKDAEYLIMADQIKNQLMYQAIIATVVLLMGTFCLRAKPRTPPSASADIETIPFLEGIKSMLRNF